MGPDRVGKSTLLALPAFIRLAIHESLNDAVREVFDGPAYLRNHTAPLNLPSGVGLSYRESAWDLQIAFAGGTVASPCAEQVTTATGHLLRRELGATHGEDGERHVPLGKAPIPRNCWDRAVNLPLDERTGSIKTSDPNRIEEIFSPVSEPIARAAVSIAWAARTFISYRSYEYQLTHLLRYGSRQSSDIVLLRNGENLFPLLRNWRDDSDSEHRFEFVLETLRDAFPHVTKLDFEQAGQSVTMAIRDARWSDRKLPISRESTGLVTALLQLCAVASCPRGGMVTLDEPETSLHPRAIQVLLEAFRHWAREHDLRIVLATQSETVLDQFHDCPEQIYVLEPGQETSPRSLTDMFGAGWLSQFSLGDLFAHLEFGSNREP